MTKVGVEGTGSNRAGLARFLRRQGVEVTEVNRPNRSPDPVTPATKASLSSLAHRIQSLDTEITSLDEQITSLVHAAAPDLIGLFDVGPHTVASLLVAAGDNPESLHSEAAWARVCCVAPIPAGSSTIAGHHRLHQGGDRQANGAL